MKTKIQDGKPPALLLCYWRLEIKQKKDRSIEEKAYKFS
jgi:hypothetical protein